MNEILNDIFFGSVAIIIGFILGWIFKQNANIIQK